MLLSVPEIEKKILDSISFLVSKSGSKKNVEVFISIHEKSYIKCIDFDNNQEIIPITIHDGNKIFDNLKNHKFYFPSFVQSLTINLTMEEVPSFNVVYIPMLNLEDEEA